jgi:hypothetical protein
MDKSIFFLISSVELLIGSNPGSLPLSLIFESFCQLWEGKSVEITDSNFTDLHRLCEEFGFSDFFSEAFKVPSLDGLERCRGCGCTEANGGT